MYFTIRLMVVYCSEFLKKKKKKKKNYNKKNNFKRRIFSFFPEELKNDVCMPGMCAEERFAYKLDDYNSYPQQLAS